MTEDENNDIDVKCVFCGKELEQHEMVRFRGAISCRECAEKQKPLSNPIAKPFLYLAGVGCLVGMVNFLYFTIHGYLLTPIYLSAYIQPLVPYYTGMIITLVLFSLGLYYINRIHLHVASIIGMLTALIAASISALALIDFVTTGPYYIVESITYTKMITYYPNAIAAYSIFGFVAGLSILLHMANIKTENIPLASAGLFLLSAALVMTSWTLLYASFIHVLAYAVTFVFFVTRKPIFEEEPIKPL
ncbi:MAG: hypothetical protein KAU48_07100 [Candidatus Thorarchaeota archaeon]|nr:hypothetical protein [Candidatus Thorarchaeota archaeon]